MKILWVAILSLLVNGCVPREAHKPRISLRANSSSSERPEEVPPVTASDNLFLAMPGVVVEKIPESSALWKAGIRPHDVLFSWARLLVTSNKVDTAAGLFQSPFDFLDEFQIEQIPRGVVVVRGVSQGVDQEWRVATGEWEAVEVRPNWIGDPARACISKQHRVPVLGTQSFVVSAPFNQKLGAWVLLQHELSLIQSGSPSFDAGKSILIWDQNRWVSDSERAVVFQRLGFLLEAKGRVDEAGAFYDRSLLLRRLAMPNSLRVASSLHDVGDIAKRQGRLDEAFVLYNQAIELRSELGPGSLSLAASFHNLANLESARGNLRTAEGLHSKALSIRSRMAPDGGLVPVSLNSLAIHALKRGDLSGARSLFLQALERIDNQPTTTRLEPYILHNLGLLAHTQGDLELAVDLYSEALSAFERNSSQSVEAASILNNLGLIVLDQGSLAVSRIYFQRALDLINQLAPNGPEAVRLLENIADIDRRTGDLDSAHGILLSALSAAKSLASKSLLEAAVLKSLGEVVRGRGDIRQAEQYFENARAIIEFQSPDSLALAGVLNSLGTIAFDRRDLVLAQSLFSDSSALFQSLAPENLQLASVLSNLGNVARKQERFSEAIDFYESALDLIQRLAPGSLRQAAVLQNLAVVSQDTGQIGDAIRFHAEALEIRRALAPDSYITADSLFSLAHLELQTGYRETAIERFLEALEVLGQHLDNVGGSYRLEAEYRSIRHPFYHDTISLLSLEKRFLEAFEVSESFRAQTFLKMLAERDLTFREDLPDEIYSARQSLRARYERTIKRLHSLRIGADDEELEEIYLELEEIDFERELLEERIRESAPAFGSMRYPSPLNSSEVRQRLDEGTLLVSFSIGEDASIVMTLSAREPIRAQRIEVSEASIRERIGRLRDVSLESSELSTSLGDQRREAFGDMSRALYKILVEPLEDRIAGSERLLILPEGALHGLPWGALLGQDEEGNDRYLVEWKPIHVGLSATAYVANKELRPSLTDELSKARALNVTELVAFGDPDYPESFSLEDPDARVAAVPDDAVLRSMMTREGLGFNWNRLSHARREIEGIASLFPQDKIQLFLGLDATEENLKGLDRDIGILHIAAHAHTDDRLPLSSFVALSIPETLPEGRDNGLLQAWEILEQVRINADLVVLSGCMTGMGQELRGEGLIGLTRAFQYAGARSLISSLWNVSDQATSELMIRFYEHLRSGLTKDEALRAAQIEFIQKPITSVDAEGNPELLSNTDAPFYWAGFQLYGDWM